MRTDFEHVDLGEHFGCLIFEIGLLRSIVFLHVLAGAIFEVEVAKVVVEHFFPLAKVFEACLLVLLLDVALRIEDVEEDSEKKDATGEDDHSSVSLRIRSRIAGKFVARGTAGIVAAR